MQTVAVRVALALALALALPTLFATERARASGPEMASLGFSNLVFRLEDEDEIGVASEDFKVHILETLRDGGFEAVGAEDLVFGKDRSEAADFMLGGTVTDDACEQYCEDLVLGGFDDWRLASDANYQSVFDCPNGRCNCSDIPKCEALYQTSGGVFWTSDGVIIDFNGGPRLRPDADAFGANARCVRGP